MSAKTSAASWMPRLEPTTMISAAVSLLQISLRRKSATNQTVNISGREIKDATRMHMNLIYVWFFLM
jgi:hypothetical protein